MESENKKIAFVIGNMQRDGAERVISILAEYYCQNGWHVDILTLLGNKCEYQLNPNINLIPICRENKSYFKNVMFWLRKIRKYVKERKPDKIVSFFARINILTIISCLGLGKSIIVSERNDPTKDGRNFFVKLATYLLYPLANHIVFQTKWAKSCFPEKIQNKSTIIPNPIQITTEALHFKNKKIVSVGRLIEQKNHSLLVKAFEIVHDVHPNYKLYIFGEGKLRDGLKKEIQFMGLQESVFLPGNVVDIHEKIADAEIFVLSSNYEGLSNALLESMLMGLPCISTDCAGSNEIIINNYNGILVPVGDVKELADSVLQLIKHKDKAKTLGINGKKSVQYMKKDNIILKWQNVIDNN